MSNWQCVDECKQTKNVANQNSGRQNAAIITRHRIEWMNEWSGYQWSRSRETQTMSSDTHAYRSNRMNNVVLVMNSKTCNRSSCDVTFSFVRFALETVAVNHSIGETLHRMWNTYRISLRRNDVNCVFSNEAYRRWVFALDALVSMNRFPTTFMNWLNSCWPAPRRCVSEWPLIFNAHTTTNTKIREPNTSGISHEYLQQL